MRPSYLVLAMVWFALLPVRQVFAQDAVSPQRPQNEEVRKLNVRISAQDQQLAAQQAQIKALQQSMDEQKALILQLLHPHENPPAAAVPVAPVVPAPVPPVVATTAPSSTVAPASSSILQQEQKEEPYKKAPSHWYDRYSLRGYVQIRENNLVNTNALYKCEQCDKSIGPNNTLFIRRARLVFSGNVSDHVSVYIQPDFASSSGTGLNYAQLRDAYFDVSIDQKKEGRLRFGQSKIPYGFEEMQSSSNRLDFDRSDALNSAFPNERDLGVFYYWAPAYIRARFNELVSRGLKGSGDFGAFGAGFFNGQGLNTADANEDFHYVARYTYPFQLRNGQFIETSIQGYTGNYSVPNVSPSTMGKKDFRYGDRRIATSLIIYPQPLGLQVEYNGGTGPEYNPATKYIDQKGLNGGYALLNYRYVLPRNFVLHPYLRFQYYSGGKKAELDARKYLVREGDFGIEAQLGKFFEITPQYQYGDRTFEDGAKPNNRQKGSLLRLQLQFNY
jgi:hypothetical protein